MTTNVATATVSQRQNRVSLAVAGGLLVLILLWGTSFLTIKIALGSFPPLFLAGSRMAIAAPLLLGLSTARGFPLPARRRDVLFFAGVGLLASGLTPALTFWGQRTVSIGLGSILFASSPLFTVVVGHWFLRDERLTRGRLIGVLVGLAGVTIVTGGSLSADDASHLPQILALLLGSLTWAIALIAMKRFPGKFSPLPTVAIQAATGALLLVPLSLTVFEVGQPVTLTPASVALFIYMTLAMTCGSQSLYLWLMPRVSAMALSYISCVVPLIAVVTGAVVLGESVGPAVLIGGTLVVAGLVLVNRGKE